MEKVEIPAMVVRKGAWRMFGVVRRREEAAGARGLVLAFDAGCLTCSELARRIEERVGDRMELRSLRSPQVQEWRRRALGDDAPWAPTLIEVKGLTVRAWTGPSMGIHLSRFLGPVTSWRVMQVLGESGAEAASERLGERPLGAVARAVSRREFLKGAGGVVVGASILAGFGWIPLATNGRSTAQAQTQESTQDCSFREPTYSYEELTGKERDTYVNANFYYNPQFRKLWDTFYAAGFKPRPDAARVVKVTYTTSGGTTRNAYDLRVPFEGVGQQYPVLAVTANQSAADTSMAVFQRVSETDEASRVDVYRTYRKDGRLKVRYARSWQGPFPSTDAAAAAQEAPTPASSELIAPEATSSETTSPEVTAPQVTATEAAAPQATTAPSLGSSPCEDCNRMVEAVASYTCYGLHEIGCGLVCFKVADRYVDFGGCEPQCGTAIAAVCAAGVPADKDKACQPFCDHVELTGDELVKEARRGALSQDMLNVGPGAAWSAGMQVGPVSESCTTRNGDDVCLTFICHDPAAGCDSHFDDNPVIAPGSTAIQGGVDTCSDGNKVLTVSYVTSDGKVYIYREYGTEVNGKKTEARRYRIERSSSGGIGTGVLEDRSVNGNRRASQMQGSSLRSTDSVSAQQYDEGCSEDAPCSDKVCNEPDFDCVADRALTCGGICAAAPATGGFGTVLCVGCAGYTAYGAHTASEGDEFLGGGCCNDTEQNYDCFPEGNFGCFDSPH